MSDRLHSSFQRLSQFSGDMAHDLRTPINNLMVQTRVALSQPRSLGDYQALLVSNVEECERLARMLDNMLFLARADEAQVRVVKQSLDTQSELHRIAEYSDGVAAYAGVRIKINVADTVVADPTLFRRAVNNLIANAIRHTPAGGVITMTAKAQQKDTAISITNPGAGMDRRSCSAAFSSHRLAMIDDIQRQTVGFGHQFEIQVLCLGDHAAVHRPMVMRMAMLVSS